MRASPPIGVVEVHDLATARVLAFQLVDTRAGGPDRLVQAQRPQRRQPGRLQQQTRAERTRGGEGFQQGDGMASARQGQRGGHAADAAPDDADAKRRAQSPSNRAVDR